MSQGETQEEGRLKKHKVLLSLKEHILLDSTLSVPFSLRDDVNEKSDSAVFSSPEQTEK